MNSSDHLAQLRQVAEPICLAHGVQLVDARFSSDHGFVLRVLIERPGADAKRGAGVSLEDCQRVSRDLSTALDVADGVAPESAYRLRSVRPVSTDRFFLADFARFAGESVKVQTHAPFAGRRRFSGKLLGTEGDTVQLEQDGQIVALPHAEIAKAHLVPEF